MSTVLWPNQPASLAKALGIDASVHHQRCRGGDGPQATTTLMAQRIASGHVGTEGLILLSGAMAANTLRAVVRQAAGEELRPYEGARGVDVQKLVRERLGWGEDLGSLPEFSGTSEVFNNEQERRHGLHAPVDAYPLYESRLRHAYGHGIEEHQRHVAEIMSRFTKVAASGFNAGCAWHPLERSSGEIATPSPRNRWVGWPYTKYMNASATVDHSASWLMCSVATAERLGIPEEKWVYVHGGAYANQGDPRSRPTWFVSRWGEHSRIPAMEAALRGALASARLTADRVQHFDFYACFPSVVQMAADCLGLPHDDPRGLTVTGGLPYYGQCGTVSSIAAMLQALRLPENRGHFGLVSGNGGLGQKHAAGVYSTAAPDRAFQEVPWAKTQAKVDALPVAPFADSPRGAAEILTYCVKHGRQGPLDCIVIGKLRSTGAHFIANTPRSPELFSDMMSSEWIGRTGTVAASPDGRRNIFTPDGVPLRSRV
uniref:Thiolase-like protein type 1 additional C-terminal domain-containing protein n=1 Tax=Alexandrium catenella TaxID=2925 RepID=A0A7S1RWN1_ALECA